MSLIKEYSEFSERRFCVYVYLDPREEGLFEYGGFEFINQPIYVGKGLYRRPKEHFYRANKSNVRFYNKIKSIINNGYTPIYFVVEYEMTEDEAFQLERELIKRIGRIENGGPLTNLSDGGEGQSGFKFSDESKLKMSNSRKGKILGPMSDVTKKNISDSKKGIPSTRKGKKENISDEMRKKLSDLAKEKVGEKNPMFNKKHSELSKELMSKNRVRKFGKDNPNFGREYKEEEKTTDIWELTHIDGRVIIINNLSKFCRDNGLNATCMRDIFYGRMKNHKGWIKVTKLTDNVKKKSS